MRDESEAKGEKPRCVQEETDELRARAWDFDARLTERRWAASVEANGVPESRQTRFSAQGQDPGVTDTAQLCV